MNFKKKFKPSNFILFLLIIIVSFLLFRDFVMFILILFLVSIFVYFNYHIKLPFDISPVLVVSLIISNEYGIWYSVTFIIVSGIIPMILAGGSFDYTTLFYLSLILLINYVYMFFTQYSFLFIAFPLIVLHHFIAMIGGIFFGINKQKEIINFILKLTIDNTYLIVFSRIISQPF